MPTILITGANRGIGLALTEHYLEAGWKILACCRHPETAIQLLKLAQHYQAQLQTIKLDLDRSEDIDNLSTQLQGQPIDILFNNAGIFRDSKHHFGEVEMDEWLETFKINTITPLLVAQALVQNVQQSSRKIIANMSSSLGSITNNTTGGNYAYRSSKVALNAVTKSLAVDLKDQGITVVSLDPGWVKTDMGGPNAPIDTKESVQGLKKVLDDLTLKDSGRFIRYTGEEQPW